MAWLSVVLVATACVPRGTFYGPSRLPQDPALRLEVTPLAHKLGNLEVELRLVNESSRARRICIGYPWDYDVATATDSQRSEGYEVITSAHGKGLCDSPSVELAPGAAHSWTESLMHSLGDDTITNIRIKIRVYPLNLDGHAKRRDFLECVAEWAEA